MRSLSYRRSLLTACVLFDLVACVCSTFGQLHHVSWGAYSEDDLNGMVVRGINFLSDKKKIDSGPALYKLMHADIFKTKKDEERMAHYASKKDSYAYQRWERYQARQAAVAAGTRDAQPIAASHAATAALIDDPLAPLIVINFLIPGGSSFNMNLVLYFARRVRTADQLRQRSKVAAQKPPSKGQTNGTAADWESEDYPHDLERIGAFDKLLGEFISGSDEFRDGRLKIVPRVAEGSWVVKKSIGRVPAILGKKVKQFYYYSRARNYLEIDADLGTSMVAGRIISMVKGTCKGLVVDMSFLLQGEDKTELPESLLGGIRMIRVDLDKITFLEENNKRNPLEFDFSLPAAITAIVAV